MSKRAGFVDDDITKRSPSDPVRASGSSEAPRAGQRSLPPSNAPQLSTSETPILHGKFRVLGTPTDSGDELSYRAIHLGTGRRVELHVLPEGASANGSEAQRLLRAARVAGRVPHPNLRNVVDSGLDPAQRPFVVYEQFAGLNALDFVAREGPLEVSRAIEIMSQVLDGLTALHERGIVHRQIRPEHVLIDAGDDLRVKLVGLGYAALAERPSDNVELPRGYSRYLAPEARRRGERPSPGADVFSAGVLLRFLLTGDPSREKVGEDAVERAIDRATADDVDERFHTAEQFRACLSAITAGPRLSMVPSGSLISDLRFMLQRRAADGEHEPTETGASAGLAELYPVLLMIESLYARIGEDGWRALLERVPELETVLPAAGNGSKLRARGVSLALVRAMLHHADQLACQGSLRLVTELGDELARRGLARFCLSLPQQLTPEGLVACVPALWRSVVRDGEVLLLEQRPNSARFSLRVQAAPSLELTGLFAALVRGQLRALSEDAEVNLLAAQSLGDGADIFALGW